MDITARLQKRSTFIKNLNQLKVYESAALNNKTVGLWYEVVL